MERVYKEVALYPIAFEPHAEGGYFAHCPLLQGCHADGETLGEAIDTLRNVIEAHVAEREAQGEFVPVVEAPREMDLRFTLPLPVRR